MNRVVAYGGFLALVLIAVVIVLALGTAPKKQPGIIGQPGATVLPLKQDATPAHLNP